MASNSDSSCFKDNLTPLKFNKVSFSWPNGSKALNQCTFSIDKPGLWMLVGKNGSGKSTLFRLIRGMLKPQSGEIICDLKQSLMFQNPDHQLLMPTCRSDLLLSCPPNISFEESNRRIEGALNQVDLQGMSNRPIHSLSGGQKQRLALAGALIAQAELLLLDEPTALLDPDNQSSVLRVVKKLSNSSNPPITALWITHRLEELEYCDGAAIMTKGCVGDWISGAEVLQQLKILA